jgi:hypothetical protein
VLQHRDPRDGLSAGCWALGGTIWVVHVAVLNARPEGCIAAACNAAGATIRPTEDLLWLFLLAVSALAIGMVYAPSKGRAGRTGRRVATGLMFAGAAALTLGLAVNSTITGDSALWWLHDSDSMGRFLPVLGSAIAGVVAWRGQWLERWHGVLLGVTALASLGFNAQTDRILFTLPLGAAWALLGLSRLYQQSVERSAQTTPVSNPISGSEAGA